MNQEIRIKRTTSNDPDFHLLISHLDHELWDELNEDQATYDQYNKVPDLSTVILLYAGDRVVACGCFKKYNNNTVEIKRMFVEKDHRGKGLSKIILDELEKWAAESGFQYAILETSVHFKVAQTLYANAGYSVIENYDQYQGLGESVCMKKELKKASVQLVLENMEDIEHFDFENDFVEHNIRCIPMIVRFKMDRAGIKLKLTEWSKFKVEERTELAKKPCSNEEQSKEYNKYLSELIKRHTGNEATSLAVEQKPGWRDINSIPEAIIEKGREFGVSVSIKQWQELSNLQRFALLKLTRPGHESKNFVKAIKEFGLLTKVVI